MERALMRAWLVVSLVFLLVTADAFAQPVTLRVATFNIEDVRTDDLLRSDQPRVRAVAEVLQRTRPNVVLINEIAYDMKGGPYVGEDDEEGKNGERLLERYVHSPQIEGLEPVRYMAFMAPTNTGVPSGFDLDKSGEVVTTYPAPPGANERGEAGRQTDRGRAFGGDCWGFGTFPGQYAMALLVDERLEIVEERVRTFQLLPWRAMPGALLPPGANGEGSYFTDEEIEFVRLSSKSHWDVPVRLPNGTVVHFLCSHPTPPGFDGDEDRNGRRNHDEIRFWRDYIDGASWIVDDQGRAGGLGPDELFVILGDQNADPIDGDGRGNPIGKLLLSSRKLAKDAEPRGEPVEGLKETATARWKLRVDYVLPSARIDVVRSGVWRTRPVLWEEGFPSDHYPVWMDVSVPGG